MTLGSHIGPLARSYIENADVVFVAVSDAIVELWVKQMNRDVRSLQPYYREGKSRADTYNQMVEAMLVEVRAGKNVSEVRATARSRRHHRLRKKVAGTAERPRLVVFRSNRGIEAQLVDDLEGKTLAAASWLNLKKSFKGSKSEQAAEVGKLLAANAKKANVETVVFDRGGYLYHGRVKALADAAREGGLKF